MKVNKYLPSFNLFELKFFYIRASFDSVQKPTFKSLKIL